MRGGGGRRELAGRSGSLDRGAPAAAELSEAVPVRAGLAIIAVPCSALPRESADGRGVLAHGRSGDSVLPHWCHRRAPRDAAFWMGGEGRGTAEGQSPRDHLGRTGVTPTRLGSQGAERGALRWGDGELRHFPSNAHSHRWPSRLLCLRAC